MQTFWRLWPLFSYFMAACAIPAPATASELELSRDAIQAIVMSTLFNDQGRWYFVKGVCYVYVERPHVALAAGRLLMDAHLSSRVGLVAGNSCMGTDFASDVRLSGRFIGAGSQITLADIRIDDVKDDSTRQALDLLQSAAGTALPRSVNIDLLELVNPAVVPGTGVKVAVTQLNISAVNTLADKVTVAFDMKLRAR